jgi:Rne/Rng family ribonuclease
MAKEICISSTPHETRLAILEDDQLAEIYYERENEYTLAGSIYKGRVTRVLPGMQSAFVDLGLERDAFLYVTDFIELEDQEESDELEKAAASGPAEPAARDARQAHPGDRGGRHEERGGRGGQRSEHRPAPAQEYRPTEEAAAEPVGSPASESTVHTSQPGMPQTPDEMGARRWRGRRRRRGGRGMSPQSGPQAEFESKLPAPVEPRPDAEEFPVIHALEAHATPQRPREHQVQKPFVLPGESLSKYGGEPAADAPEATPERAMPPRRTYTSRPSTLIEAPIAWDGSGLLPGESISKHRRQPEPARPEAEESQADVSAELPGYLEREELAVDDDEAAPPSLRELEMTETPEANSEFEEESLAADSIESPSEEAAALEDEEGADGDEPEFEEFPFSATAGHRSGEEESVSPADPEEEADASASHNIDPSTPTGFRLFGFGGKKKKEDEAAVGTAAAAPEANASSYAPGNGVIEEEVIEGEELESAPHGRRHKPEVNDLDDYEEQTLPSHLRTGELGEMLQEAHLDHRIQMNFDEKADEEEDVEVAEEEAHGGTQPAPGRDRHERGGRGQRGRGMQGGRRGPPRRSAQTTDLPIISDLLKAGQEILVQIAKEPIAKKGARITSHIALPGRFLVFMPTVTHVGVSRKIASDDERRRLKRILMNERGEASGGFIVRTAADGASEAELRADLRFLMNLWNDIKQRSDSSKSPALIYHDLSLIERVLRDQVSANFASIWVDTQEDYERIVRFLNRFSPSLVRRVKLYTKETPLFEHFGIQDEISKALRSKVWLKSGGSIVINQTEALVAIDINTGKYVGKSARLEDTILKTNLDAVPEIVRQIRLRDLGGIIVIDFIDMDERKNRYKVMAALEEALKNDRAPTKVLQFNDFGLVAITRKRVKQSLERTLSVACPTCQATGMVKSPATVCNEIYIEMRKMRKHFENTDVLLRVNPETVKVLKSNGNRWLNDFEELIGKNVLVKSDPTLHPEQFDIQG